MTYRAEGSGLSSRHQVVRGADQHVVHLLDALGRDAEEGGDGHDRRVDVVLVPGPILRMIKHFI